MKLTEAKLKQMIKEAMSTAPLPHLDAITDMFARSKEEAKSASSFIESLEQYDLASNVQVDETTFWNYDTITIIFKDSDKAQQFHDALEPKMKRRSYLNLIIGGFQSYVSVSYDKKDKL